MALNMSTMPKIHSQQTCAPTIRGSAAARRALTVGGAVISTGGGSQQKSPFAHEIMFSHQPILYCCRHYCRHAASYAKTNTIKDQPIKVIAKCKATKIMPKTAQSQ